MANPITWQNVAGNALENAWRPMQGAVTTIDSGFDRLMKMISDRQEVNQGILDRGREGQVLDAKELLGRLKDPNQVAEVQPQIDAIRASLPARFRAELLGAEDARRASLQDMYTKRVAYDNTRTDQEQHPLVQQYRALQATDPIGAKAFLDKNPQLRNIGDLAREGHVQEQADTKFKRDGDYLAQQTQRLKDETRIGDLQVGVQQQQANNSAESNRLANLERLNTAIVANTTKRQELANKSMDAPDAQKTLEASLDKLEPDVRNSIISRVNQAMKDNPALRALPVAVVAQYASAHGNPRWYEFNRSAGSGIGEELGALLDEKGGIKDQRTLDHLTANANSVALIDAQTLALRRELNALQRGGASAPVATGSAPAPETPVPNPSPNPTPSPAPEPTKPPAATPQADTRLVQLAQTELALRDRGELKELSPEVQKFVDQQRERDKQALVGALRESGSGTAKLGAAAADIFTLPARAGMGLVNNAVRGINAVGGNVPYIPDSNGIISSITPYSDMLARRSQGGEVADLKARREKLQRELADAGKKAR